MLELRDLTFAGNQEGISHRFAPGSITVVLGRNNAGKTWLARSIAGLESSPSGTIWIDGQDVSQLGARDRRVGLVYQAFVNYPTLTVYQNIASPLVALKRSREAIRQTVRELAERLQIEALLERSPSELSGGQQQRVAIARALAQGGSVLVMDEPLVNLDYKLREELQLQLRDLLSSGELVVVYTTSDPQDAFKLGDEVLLLDAHRVLQGGPPLEVYREPKTLAIADLMSDPGVNVVDANTALRPEHLALERRAATDIEFQTELVGLETNGSETFLHCQRDARVWVVKLQGMVDIALGTACALFAHPADVLRFGESRGGD